MPLDIDPEVTIYDASMKFLSVNSDPNVPSPKINSYFWSLISFKKNTLSLDFTSVILLTKLNTDDIELLIVSLTVTLNVDTSMLVLSNINL